MRRGVYFFKAKDVNIARAAEFPPFQVAFTFVGSFLIWVSFFVTYSVVIFALLFPAGRRAASNFLLNSVFVPVVTAVIVFLVVRYVSRYVLSEDRTRVNHLKRYMWMELWLLAMASASAILFFFRRLVLFASRMFHALIRCDMTILSDIFQAADTPYQAYLACIFLDHYYNSPVPSAAHDVFLSLFLNAKARAQTGTVSAVLGLKSLPPSTAARKRWYLAYTLARNPVVQSLRKPSTLRVYGNSTKDNLSNRPEADAAESPHCLARGPI
jgi:amino acid transporter